MAKHPLSVAAGELTPNLKVRRNIVAKTRYALVEALYDGWAQANTVAVGDMLHQGDES